MEKKNTILLTVIAVATLLVAVVGATFAYFTATTSTTGDGASTGEVDTAEVASVKLTKAETGKSTTTIYPGTTNYAGMSITASKEGSDAAEYDITYTLSGTVTLSEAFTKGAVSYKVYRTTTPVETPVTCTDPTATPSATGTQYSQECTVDNTMTTSGTEVASGTVDGTTASISISEQELSTSGNTQYYYYLVVSYEKKNEDQNDDQGKTITASLTDVSITNTAKAE